MQFRQVMLTQKPRKIHQSCLFTKTTEKGEAGPNSDNKLILLITV